MVIYDLVCDNGHQFEGWFKSSDDLQMQAESALLLCPFCESAQVTKKLTAAKVGRKSNAGAVSPIASNNEVISGSAAAPEKFAKLQKMLSQVHDYIDNNFQDVGNRFSEQAIKIHHGEADPCNIRGTATREQVKEMSDAGVTALPLPPKPIDPKKVN